MRLRRLATRTVLLGCVALLALGPAVPAAAEEPAPAASPTGSPTVSPVESPAPLPSETPAPAESEPPRTPEQKIEVGLAGEKTPSRVIVELRDEAETAPVAEQAEGLAGSEVVLKPDNDSFIVVEGTGNSLTELAADPRVVSIRRDRAYPPSLASSIKVIGADQAHAAGTTGAGQTIVVMDTGVDRDHPFLAGRVVDEACFSATSEEGLPLESLCPNGQASQTGPGSADAETAKCLDGTVNLCDHGTHVAGIAAGAGVAGAPGPGVAPGANIIAIQIFSRVNDPETCGGTASCLLAFDSTLRLGLDHVATLTGRHKIAAVNLSLGGGLSDVACDTAEEAADLKPKIDALLAQGVATVVAAGNEAFDGSAFPGCISSAVTVGATDDGDAIAPFSNRGPLLDFFAPGVEIDSSVPDDAYTGYSGTSMAAPHVAGALALLKEKFPDAPVTELIDKLRASGRGIVYGNVTTPRIDVNAALTGASPSPPVTQAPDPGESNQPAPDDPGTGDDPGDDIEESPTPDPTSAPAPEPEETPAPDPTPVPLPTVTVTVTITVTPSPPSTGAPQVCTRGTSRTPLTAAKWAKEMAAGKAAYDDATLTCYLSLVAKASTVFPEVKKAATPAAAAKILKSKASAKKKAGLDRELLAAWLNWASGARNITAKVTGSATLKSALTVAEHHRREARTTPAQISRSTTTLRKHVNK